MTRGDVCLLQPSCFQNATFKTSRNLEGSASTIEPADWIYETLYEIMPLEAIQAPYSLKFLTISNKNIGYARNTCSQAGEHYRQCHLCTQVMRVDRALK